MNDQELANYREHYNVIMKNLGVANGQLSNSLKEKEEAKKQLELVLKTLEKYSNQLTLAIADYDSKKDSVAKLNAEIESKQAIYNSFNDSIKEIENYYKEKELKLSSEYQVRLGEHNDLINKLDEEYKNKLKTKSFLDNSLNLLVPMINESQSIQSNLVQSINKLNVELENKKLESQKELSKLQDIKSGLLEEIAFNRSKIESPLEFLAQRELEMAKKERNFNVLVTRFKKYWEKNFPGQELKI